MTSGINDLRALLQPPRPVKPATKRPDWHEYFLNIADAVSERASCTRRKVGAVVVKDKRIVGTGYNGAPAGHPDCLSGACPRGRLSYEELAAHTDYDSGPGRCIALHAEVNAVLHTDREDRAGAFVFVNHAPCPACVKFLGGSGIAAVFWREGSLAFPNFNHARESGYFTEDRYAKGYM